MGQAQRARPCERPSMACQAWPTQASQRRLPQLAASGSATNLPLSASPSTVPGSMHSMDCRAREAHERPATQPHTGAPAHPSPQNRTPSACMRPPTSQTRSMAAYARCTPRRTHTHG